MKDAFGTVIEPGDAVIVARGAFAGNAGQLEVFTVIPTKKGDGLTLQDKDGRRKNYSFNDRNTIAIKSIAGRAGIGVHGGGKAAEP